MPVIAQQAFAKDILLRAARSLAGGKSMTVTLIPEQHREAIVFEHVMLQGVFNAMDAPGWTHRSIDGSIKPLSEPAKG